MDERIENRPSQFDLYTYLCYKRLAALLTSSTRPLLQFYITFFTEYIIFYVIDLADGFELMNCSNKYGPSVIYRVGIGHKSMTNFNVRIHHQHLFHYIPLCCFPKLELLYLIL